MNDLSDDILVAACRRGDKSAYAVLVRRYYRYVYAVCLGVVGNMHDAEDMAQDAMLKGFVKIDKLKRTEQFDQWVLRIARNLSYDFVRRKKHLRTYSIERPVQQLQAAGKNYDLQDAIEHLPQEYRLPLVMYYFDNKSAKNIAEKLNISHSGACQRIRAARMRLHKLLTEGVHHEQ
ncbi:MAG: RNA polymerase sigma factor [Planctomycetota bacterium]